MTRKLASSISKPFKIIYSGNHYKHDPQLFFSMGRMEKFPEMPSRIEMIKSSLVERGFTDFLSFKDFGYDPIYSVHAVEYVEYLKTAYPKWTERGGDAHGVAPDIFATRLKEVFGKHDVDHSNIFDQAANFNMDCSAVIAKDTYQVVYEGAQCSITGADHVLSTKESALVLTRPPGHHSARDLAGGFCFLNNAAIAAEYLVRRGANVTILDLDYHHGNGTQSIFWERSNPICISLHGKGDYPYFTGYAEEIGKGRGVGCNHNVPLPHGTSNELYLEALRNTIDFKIMSKRPNYLVISLGVDTFAGDPIGTFKLTSNAFLEIGKLLAGINVPTLFVIEGGYAVEAIGTNVANVISGFMNKP